MHEEPVKLTEKEYELALFLFRNRGRVLSRQHLLTTVWGTTADLNTRTVDSPREPSQEEAPAARLRALEAHLDLPARLPSRGAREPPVSTRRTDAPAGGGPHGITVGWLSGFLCLLVLASVALVWLDATRRVDNLIHDGWVRLHSGAPPEDVVIAAIDPESLEALGRWPWPRETQARLIEGIAAAGARGAVIDILYVEPGATDAADNAPGPGRRRAAGVDHAGADRARGGRGRRRTSAAARVEPHGHRPGAHRAADRRRRHRAPRAPEGGVRPRPLADAVARRARRVRARRGGAGAPAARAARRADHRALPLGARSRGDGAVRRPRAARSRASRRRTSCAASWRPGASRGASCSSA